MTELTDCYRDQMKALNIIRDKVELYMLAKTTGDAYSERMAYQRLQQALENYYRGQNN